MDPRWLEILKASGWQTAAIAAPCFLVLAADRFGLIPKLDPWMVQVTAVAMATCALLAVASCRQPGAWSRPGGRSGCPLRPRSTFQPQSASGAPGCEACCLTGVKVQLLVFW